ncbi:MAG: regulatory protein RecX [Thiomicrospira sp.]|uniref:regulatory protein RecX n=1 Tax=Thiomicrospira sp. TaxID=935 RepID=UPI0019ED64AC|nr:regulatory protein RecX [Thiomicrospira sp.]MBE0494414.1 regulatory protein RecX [Thiomicrospira sp.]
MKSQINQASQAKLESPEDLFKKMLGRAQYLLAMREHGAKELKTKLCQKFAEYEQTPGLVDEVIRLCQQKNWQSDERYVESYVRMATQKGQGPLKIRQALMRASDDQASMDAHLNLGDDVWCEIAQAALEKKYQDAHKPTERKEHAKRLRFLQSRGFSGSQCYKAFKT